MINTTLTAVDGLCVGHAEMPGRPTGCTVVLAGAGAVAGVDVRGGAPGSRETDLLDPTTTVQEAHAIVLAGGSAFGLAAADGVVRLLAERGIGYPTAETRVPIVPAAILYDLAVGAPPTLHPDADCGRRAALIASREPVREGNVGAGAGATIGKLAGPEHAMRGGIGSAAFHLDDGIVVAALIAVNALGDVIDPATGELVAGMRSNSTSSPSAGDIALADARLMIRSSAPIAARPGTNTTIGVVATNARLSRPQVTKLAQMTHDGLARAIVPAHTPFDGDTIFGLATGTLGNHPLATADSEGRNEPACDPGAMLRLGALAADAAAEATVRGIRAAVSLPGLPAARDLTR